MRKIQRMDPTLGPPNCLMCNRGNNVDDGDSMDDFWVLDIERDYNWGDPAYVCMYCCALIAEHCGHVPLEKVEELEAIIKQQKDEIHSVESERDSIRRRFRSALHGKKAVASAKKQIA